MRVPRIAAAVLAWGVCIAVAGTIGVRAVISSNIMDVYKEAVRSSESRRYPSALARLEALLLAQPVTVAIDYESVPENASELSNSLAGALQIWKDALPDSPFIVAEEGKKPQVLIRFVTEMRDLPGAQGDVQAQRDFYWSRRDYSYKLTANIRVVHRTGRRTITRDEAAGIIAHELGHLVGLDDIEDDDGLMGYFVSGRPKRRVEPEEIQAVSGFRKMVRDKIDEIKKAASI